MAEERRRQLQKVPPLGHPPHKRRDVTIQLLRHRIDLARVALPCVGKLFRSLQKLLRVCVCVLQNLI